MSRALTRIVLLWAVGGGLSGCGKDPKVIALNEAIAHLERDTNALKTAVAEAKAGTLIRPDNIIVGVHEKAVETFLRALLPMEFPVGGEGGESSTVVRIDQASVRFDAGFGTVEMQGRAWLKDWPSVAADVSVSGGFTEAQIDPTSRLLVARIGLDTLDVRTVSGGLMTRLLGSRLRHTLIEVGRENLSNQLPALEIPVKLDQTLKIPDVDQDPLVVQGGSLPLTVAFTRMFAIKSFLWLQVKPTIGTWERNAVPR